MHCSLCILRYLHLFSHYIIHIVKHKFLLSEIIIRMLKLHEKTAHNSGILTNAANIKKMRKSDKNALYFLEIYLQR